MPGIPAVYEPNNKDINVLAEKESQARIKKIDDGWRYYDGDHHQPLIVKAGAFNDNIITNLVGRAVDRTTEFAGVPKLTIAGGVDNVVSDGEINVEKSPDQEMLDALVKESDFKELLAETFDSGAVAGHNFWKIIVDKDEEGNDEVSADNLPYLMSLDSRFMTVFWDMVNPKRLLYYRMSWGLGDLQFRQDIVPGWLLGDTEFADEVKDDEWAILEYKRNKQSEFVFSHGDVWHFPFPPIVDWKNGRRAHKYYGKDDMADAPLNDSFNFVRSNTGRIIKFHAQPRTIGTGMDAEDVIATAIDGFWTVPNTEARINNLEMQSDLGSSMVMSDTLRADFFSQMRVVDISSMKERLGQITNFGVLMIYSDMLKMIDDKRARYGEYGINEAFGRMLHMLGIEVEAVISTWADPLPVDRTELVKTVEKEQQLGITSDQTLAKDLDRDYVKEQAQRQEEADIRTDDRVNNINRLAQVGVNG